MTADLSTTYLGLELPHPLMPGACPLSDDLDNVRRLEDAGAAAIVLHSLFEEQVVGEQRIEHWAPEDPEENLGEATRYFPRSDEFLLGPDEYLKQVTAIRHAVDVPVIASLNGTTPRGWLEMAREIAGAGANALELNVYSISSDPGVSGADIEESVVAMVREVKQALTIPLAVKLSPFYTALPHFARRLTRAGADGLVLFNRFYQPDLDLKELTIDHTLRLSDRSELLLRLRWLAILSGNVPTSLAVTGGVHTAKDALKALFCGAHAVQMVSTLIRHGPERLSRVRQGLERWLEESEYGSLRELQGSYDLSRCPDPSAFERANYARMLQGWRVEWDRSSWDDGEE